MADTTARGYPYPESTDDVRPHEDIEALAEAVDADVTEVAEKPIVMLLQKATQNLADSGAGNSAITFGAGSEQIDTHGFHSEVTNNHRITPNVAGYYRLRGYMYMGASTYTQLVVGFLKNGSTLHYEVTRPDPASAAVGASVEYIVSANGSSDYFELRGQQHSGGTRATNVSAGFESSFSCEYLRPL
jgi:hypothetical protein